MKSLGLILRKLGPILGQNRRPRQGFVCTNGDSDPKQAIFFFLNVLKHHNMTTGTSIHVLIIYVWRLLGKLISITLQVKMILAWFGLSDRQISLKLELIGLCIQGDRISLDRLT